MPIYQGLQQKVEQGQRKEGCMKVQGRGWLFKYPPPHPRVCVCVYLFFFSSNLNLLPSFFFLLCYWSHRNTYSPFLNHSSNIAFESDSCDFFFFFPSVTWKHHWTVRAPIRTILFDSYLLKSLFLNRHVCVGARESTAQTTWRCLISWWIFYFIFFIREWLILTFTSGKARLHFSFL